MKHLLLTTIAAVVLVGCGESQQSVPQAETKPVEPVTEAGKPSAPKIDIQSAEPQPAAAATPPTIKPASKTPLVAAALGIALLALIFFFKPSTPITGN